MCLSARKFQQCVAKAYIAVVVALRLCANLHWKWCVWRSSVCAPPAHFCSTHRSRDPRGFQKTLTNRSPPIGLSEQGPRLCRGAPSSYYTAWLRPVHCVEIFGAKCFSTWGLPPDTRALLWESAVKWAFSGGAGWPSLKGSFVLPQGSALPSLPVREESWTRHQRPPSKNINYTDR